MIRRNSKMRIAKDLEVKKVKIPERRKRMSERWLV